MRLAKLKVGDIVLVPFPFSDNSNVKVRPSIIIGMDRDDINFVFITSIKPEEYYMNIKMDSDNNLKSDSYIRYSKIATLDKKVCLYKLGELSKEDFEKLKHYILKYLNR